MIDRVKIIAIKRVAGSKSLQRVSEHIHACIAGLSRIWDGGALRVNSSFRMGAVPLCAALVLASASIGGCAVSQITAPFRSEPTGDGWAATVTEERLLEAAKSDNSGKVDLQTEGNECPKFAVWPRDKHLTVYEPGMSGDRSGVRHRGEITKTARECEIGPTKVTVKYGFAGRVLLGPKGKSGNYTMPVKVHVTDASRNIISTQKVNLKVNIPSGMPVGYFSSVRSISFPVKSGSQPGQYSVFVAFDTKAAGTS